MKSRARFPQIKGFRGQNEAGFLLFACRLSFTFDGPRSSLPASRYSGCLSTLRSRLFSLPARPAVLDQGNLVTGLIVGYRVHEGADQQQAAAADSFQVRRVGGIGERARIEAGTLVADRDLDFLVRQPGAAKTCRSRNGVMPLRSSARR